MRSLPTDLLASTRAALERAGGRPAPVAQRWAEQEGELRGEPAVIYGHAWETDVLCWFRVSLLEGGARARVFSALGLPRATYDLPLFGAEIVVIKGAVTVVALDWMPLFADSAHVNDLAPIRQRHDAFPPGGELPPWAAEAFSPHALFSRPREAVAEGRIVAAYGDYLGGYLALCAGARPAGTPAATLAAQRAYCRSHFTNDPGANMLANIFGAEWSEAYAREFLFRTPTVA